MRYIALIILLLSSSVSMGQGMATFDVFNWIQNQISATEENLQTAQQKAANAQSLKMIKNQLLELEALRIQITTMQNQYEALSGNSGYGRYLTGPFVALDPEQTPETWEELIWLAEKIGNGEPQNEYSERARAYADQNPYVSSKGYKPNRPTHPSNHDLNSQKSGSIAQGVYSQDIYKESNRHYQTIQLLQSEIDQADTAKKTADLSARMLSELGMMGAEQLRIASMNSQMEALDRKKNYNEEMADKVFLQYKPKNLMAGEEHR